MVHDVSHTKEFIPTGEISISQADREVLRALASEKAAIATRPEHKEKALLWRDLNDLKSGRPMVWFDEVPWHEMNVDDELIIRTEHPFAQEQEAQLRKLLYQWRHFPADMIVDDFMPCPLVVDNTGFGIEEEVDIARTDADSDIISRRYHIQIEDFDDLEKIRMPKVALDEAATAQCFAAMGDVYAGILPVRKIGHKHVWFTPWDFLIRWWGIEEAMMDMIDRPELVHAAVERMVDAWMTMMDQLDALNLLSEGANNTRVGSGGYGYCSALPGEDFDPRHVHPHNQWGCSNAQIFSEVSPEFHREFAVEHDMRWLKRFGLNYYGCCEQLHNKIEVIRDIPNLRKISCSPRCEAIPAVEKIGADFVMSRKPNPAIFAGDSWHPERARRELVDWMEATGGRCHVEFIFKDLSTVRYDPKRLWEVEAIAMKVAHEYAS